MDHIKLITDLIHFTFLGVSTAKYEINTMCPMQPCLHHTVIGGGKKFLAY